MQRLGVPDIKKVIHETQCVLFYSGLWLQAMHWTIAIGWPLLRAHGNQHAGSSELFKQFLKAAFSRVCSTNNLYRY